MAIDTFFQVQFFIIILLFLLMVGMMIGISIPIFKAIQADGWNMFYEAMKNEDRVFGVFMIMLACGFVSSLALVVITGVFLTEYPWFW